MVWEKDGLRFSRPVRWLCAKLDKQHGRRRGRPGSRPGTSRTATASRAARSSLPRADEYVDVAASGRGRARPGGAPAPDPRGSGRDRRLARPRRGARGGRLPRREPDRPHRELRRALPRAAAARRRDGDAVAPALLPARGRPLRVRRQRRRPEGGGRRQRARAGGPARGRPLHLRARRGEGDRGARRRARRRSPSSPGRAASPTRPRACRSSSESSAGARPRARPRAWPRPTRRPSSCGSSPTSKATSAPSTRGSRASRRASAPRSRSSTCRTPPTARCRRRSRGACSPPRRRSTTSRSSFALGQRPTGSRDPHGLRRAAIGLCRLAVEGGLEIDVARARPARPAASSSSRTPTSRTIPSTWPTSSSSGSRACSTCRSSSSAPRARAASPSSVRLPSSHAPCRRGLVGGVRAGLRRLRSLEPARRAAPTARPRPRPGLATDEAETALIEALGGASPRIEAAVAERDFPAAIAAAAELGPPVDRFFDEVLVMAEDERVRANRLRLLLDVRDAVGALGDLSQIPR